MGIVIEICLSRVVRRESSIESHPLGIVIESCLSRVVSRESSIENHPLGIVIESCLLRVVSRESSIESHPSRVIHRESSIESRPSRISWRVIHWESSIESHRVPEPQHRCRHCRLRAKIIFFVFATSCCQPTTGTSVTSRPLWHREDSRTRGQELLGGNAATSRCRWIS